MSSTVSQEARTLLAELLESQKDATRVWLRDEVDRLVDPMLDSIFNRLKTKLTNQMERRESSDCALVMNPFIKVEQASVIFPPSTSTSTYNSSLNPTSLHLNPRYVHAQFTSHLSTVPTPPMSITNAQITFPYELTNVQSHSMPIKHEIEAAANEPMLKGHSSQSFPSPIENERSNLANWDEDEDDEEEEECDCDRCVNCANGGIELIMNEDDGDSVDWFEDNIEVEEPSPPVKRTRLDTTPPHNAQTEVIQQCSRQATQPNQVNNHDKRIIITLSLQCPQSNCLDTFPEASQLNQHMSSKHDIGPFRCLLKDCLQSFHNRRLIGTHIKNVHQHTSQWHCHKCAKHYPTYLRLFFHNIKQHQQGHFQCAFPSCTFTGDYKGLVYSHYSQQHKPTLNCQHPACQFRTPILANLKQHQRTHFGSKPYRCKWPDCDYSAARKFDTIRHIRGIHFERHPSLVANLGDPKDFVDVVHELL